MRHALVILVSASLLLAQVPPDKAPTAARSIHLSYPTGPVLALHVAMTIEQSTPGSYFMAAGWNTGYFGLQELGNGKKVALFSVWDPTKGDDPKAVKLEERVECLHQCEGARIKRFGGEGTGGQCMIDCDWQVGDEQRFVVAATVEGEKTAYAGYLWQPAKKAWLHMVTFRVRTGGAAMTGLYSFVEDFRRDGRSVLELRRARYGEVWVLGKPSEKDDKAAAWQALRAAKFTASGAKTEDQDRVGAGVAAGAFWLATGGAAKGEVQVGERLELPAAGEAVVGPKDLPTSAAVPAERVK